MPYNYYAFVSYSRKDKAAARYLQNKLESYRYPSVLVDAEHKPENPKYLRKIFRDTSDLDVTQSNFTESIDRHLAESRYLVVLCSPNSQKSVWVDREIVRFLETHDNNLRLIFPVILEGNVPECLPERLRLPDFYNRNIPTMIPDDASSKKEGWEHGFLQLVGAMLNVSIAKITDRFQKAKQAKLRRIIFGTVAALVVTIGLTVWALIAEHRAKIEERRARAAEQKAVAAEKIAVHEASVAKETLAFIREAFAAADANQSGNKDMTLLEFADRSSTRLDKLTVPEVKLKVAEMVLPLLDGMGDPKTALARLLPLVPEAEKLYPTDSGERAEFNVMLANLYYSNARYDAAADYFRAALDYYTANGVPEKAAYTHFRLGWIFLRQGKYAEAQKEAEMALSFYRDAGMENSKSFGDSLNLLGAVYSNKGEYDKAIEYYQQSLAIKRKILGEDHPSVASALNNIGIAYKAKGEYDKAIEYYQQSLAIYRKKLGEDHPNVANTLNNIGEAYRAKGEYDKAIEYYQQSLAIKRKKLGEEHPSTAGTETGLGFSLVMKGNVEEGMKLLDHALAVRIKKLGEEHPETIDTLYYRGLARLEQARRTGSEADLSAAEHDLKQALSIREKKLGPRHPKTLETVKALEKLRPGSGK